MAKTDPESGSRQRGAPSRWGADAKRLGYFVGALLAAVVMTDALVGDRGFLAMLHARQQHDELAAAIEHQRAENAKLTEEARRLRDDPSAIEELARRELGLIRPGEKLFILKDLKTQPAP